MHTYYLWRKQYGGMGTDQLVGAGQARQSVSLGLAKRLGFQKARVLKQLLTESVSLRRIGQYSNRI